MSLLDRLKGNKEATPSIEQNALIDDIVECTTEHKAITREVAEKIGALNEGITLIADTIASLPIYLYKRDSNGDRVRQDDYRNKLLNLECSPYGTAFNLKKNVITDYLYHGNGYVDIHRDQYNNIKSLLHIPHGDISTTNNGAINKRELVTQYHYWGMTNVQAFEVINFARNTKSDELKGQGILSEGANILGNAVSFEDYTTNTMENGFYAKAVIEKDTILSKPSRKSLNGMIKKFFSGTKNSGKVMILDDGMKLKTLALSPSDLDLLSQKDFTIKDIARLLKLQPSMLGVATGGMTYSNEQDNQLVFLKNTIQPLLTLFENTINKYLLTEDEKETGYFFEFNTQSMLKTNPQGEIKMWSEAVKGQLVTVNEARRKMNWKPLDGLDRPYINLGYGLIDEEGRIISHQNELKGDTSAGKGGENNE